MPPNVLDTSSLVSCVKKGLSPLLRLLCGFVLAEHWERIPTGGDLPCHDLSVLCHLSSNNVPSEHPKERFWLLLLNSNPPS